MKTERTDGKINIENTHVPDKVYAFMIQSHHMLYELLDCKKGDTVSIEVFDDVGVEHEDGSKDAIQVKSALSDRNPVSDRAVDLWKTLYNWIIAVESNELDAEGSKFIIFITVNKAGTIVNAFQKANSFDMAAKAWEDTRKNFYEDSGKQKEIGNEYKKFLTYFYDERNKELACKIIQRFELKKCIDNYSEEVRKKFDDANVPEDIREPIYEAIVGWIDLQLTKMAEARKPIVITFENYQKELSALYREFNQKHSLMSYSRKPGDREIDSEFRKQRTYIEQLDIIDCDYTEKVEAINDYLQAASDRTIWAEKGDISLHSIKIYEEKLKRCWNLEKRMVLLEKKSDTPEEQGKMIYYKCQEKKIDMDAFFVPESFQNGCFHSLSDNLEIGWHPEYRARIKGKDKDNE